MNAPVFDYIPVLNASAAALRVVTVTGISTRHGSNSTDRGRLYASVTKPAGFRLDIYSDVARAVKVLTGTAPALSTYFDLADAGTSGMSGRAMIQSYDGDDAGIVLLPTFATDRDVYVEPERAAAMPAYDPKYGLAVFHAQAMQQLLAADLPRAVPHLFGKTGLATFLPSAAAVTLPALTKIANADQLRIAQASLVRALSAEQVSTEEFRSIAADARTRYADAMNALGEANLLEPETEADVDAGLNVSVSTWRRM